jgi:hypothetical protein
MTVISRTYQKISFVEFVPLGKIGGIMRDGRKKCPGFDGNGWFGIHRSIFLSAFPVAG